MTDIVLLLIGHLEFQHGVFKGGGEAHGTRSDISLARRTNFDMSIVHRANYRITNKLPSE